MESETTILVVCIKSLSLLFGMKMNVIFVFGETVQVRVWLPDFLIKSPVNL